MNPSINHHIIGAGRFGTCLARRMKTCNLNLVSVSNHNPVKAMKLSEELGIPHDIKPDIKEEDWVWLCVTDDQIRRVAYHVLTLQPKARIIHSSGHTDLVENTANTGVVWPIYSFNAVTEPNWAEVPIIIEATNETIAQEIKAEVEKFVVKTPKIVTDTADRRALHIGAVIIHNFSNYLWIMADEVLDQSDRVNYKDLLPLIENHLKALHQHPPIELQSGPAIRKDRDTERQHARFLKMNEPAQRLYRFLSREIRKKMF